MTVRWHRLPVLLIACLVVLLGAVACGGGNETVTEADRTATSTDAGDTASTPTTSSTTTTTTTPPPGPQPGVTYEGSIEGQPRLTGEVTVVIADSGEAITELMVDFDMQEFNCDGSVMSGGLGLGIRGPVPIIDNTFQASDGMMNWEGTFDTSESATGTVEGSLPVLGGDPCPVGPFPWTAVPNTTTTDTAATATTTTEPTGVRPTTTNVASRVGEEATFCGGADAITSRGDGLQTVYMGGLLVYIEPDANLPSRWWEDDNGDDLEFCVTGTVQPADDRGSAFITVTSSSQIRDASGLLLEDAAPSSQSPVDVAAQQFCQAWLNPPSAVDDPAERAQRVQTYFRELARLAPVEIRAGAEAMAELQDTWVEIGPEYDWDLVQAIDDSRLAALMDATGNDMDAFDLYVAQNCGN